MMAAETRRRALLAAGVATTAAGLGLFAAPGVARAFRSRPWVLLAVGLAAMAGALAVGARRRNVAVEPVDVGDPETLVELPAPGDDARRSFELAAGVTVAGSKEKVRERLTDAAVAVVSRRFDCSEAEARRRLARGDWTDDPFATAFLADETGPEPPRVPATTRLRVDPFTYRARRTVDAIVALAGMEGEP